MPCTHSCNQGRTCPARKRAAPIFERLRQPDAGKLAGRALLFAARLFSFRWLFASASQRARPDDANTTHMNFEGAPTGNPKGGK